MFEQTSNFENVIAALPLNSNKFYSKFFSSNMLNENFSIQNIFKYFSYGKSLYSWNFISNKNQKTQTDIVLLNKIYNKEIKANNFLKQKSFKLNNSVFSNLELKILEKIPIYFFFNKTEKNERFLSILENKKSLKVYKKSKNFFMNFQYFENFLVNNQFKIIKNFTNFFDSDMGKNFKILIGFNKLLKKDVKSTSINGLYFIQMHSIKPNLNLLKSFSTLSKGNFFIFKKGKDYLNDIYVQSLIQKTYKPKQVPFIQKSENLNSNYSIYKLPNIYKEYFLEEQLSILPIFLDKKDMLKASSFNSQFNRFFNLQKGSGSFSSSIYETNLAYLLNNLNKDPVFSKYKFLIFPSSNDYQNFKYLNNNILSYIKVYLLDFSDSLESLEISKSSNEKILYFYPFKNSKDKLKLYITFSLSKKEAIFLWNNFSSKFSYLSNVPKIYEISLSELFLAINKCNLNSNNLSIIFDSFSLNNEIQSLLKK